MLNKHSKIDIIKTNDGSKTIFIPDKNEHFHSFHGALNESTHVFIENGLNNFSLNDKVNILEIGFGTGLNSILTFINSNNKIINYTGIDSFPLDYNILKELNYRELFDSTFYDKIDKIQNSNWNEEITISSNFKLLKINNDVYKYKFKDNFYNLIYFDAFGPRVQPEMWTFEILKKMYNSLNHGAYFVTYCAKGQVKRDLKDLGFKVETLNGPPGKREMIRAIKV